MSIAEPLAAEFDVESAITRKVLAAVPEASFGWRPHAKSFTLGGLASHISNICGWGLTTLEMDVFAMEPGWKQPEFATSAEMLETFDKDAARFAQVLRAETDDHLRAPWKMTIGGHTVMEHPREDVLRTFVYNHAYHHRGQLTMYLRMLDVMLPEVYGPNADTPKIG